MDRYLPTAEPVSATRVPPGPTHDFGPFMTDISAKGATAWSVKPTGVLIKFGDNRGRTYAWGSWLIFDEGDLGHMPRADLDDDAFRSTYRLDLAPGEWALEQINSDGTVDLLDHGGPDFDRVQAMSALDDRMTADGGTDADDQAAEPDPLEALEAARGAADRAADDQAAADMTDLATTNNVPNAKAKRGARAAS